MQRRGDDVFSQRAFERAAAVGHDHVARDQLGKEQMLDASRSRVQPTQSPQARKERRQLVALQAVAQNDLCLGAELARPGTVACHARLGQSRQTLKQAQVLAFRVAEHEYSGSCHPYIISRNA
jgi:hypothetical protein